MTVFNITPETTHLPGSMFFYFMGSNRRGFAIL